VLSSHPPGDIEQVFARSGAMAPYLAACDWAATGLGDPATWPQSLRSAASICLGAKYPIAIYWGPELTLLYNEAWSAIPGDKHPWCLGRPGREVWPDIWHVVGPDFERALAGEGTWEADRLLPMQRHGFLEETYFNYNLSPILSEDGRIAGVFNAGLETTGRVVASRHQRVLIDLIAETASATTVGEAFAGAIAALAQHREVAPFAVLYRLDDGVAHLAGSTGVADEGEGTGTTVELGSDDDPWRIQEAIDTRRAVVTEDIGRFADVQAFDGWPEPAHTAVTLPVVRSRRKRRRVEGILVVGMPPGLRMDAQHEEFHAALADRFALSVLDARREEDERRTFRTEHRIAATLQQSLIPALPELEVVGLAGCYLPGTDGLEVGGDWYDAIPLADGSVTVVIGDVVGKGVAAAAQMGQLRNALRAYVLEGFSPGEVLAKLNHLTLSLSGSTFATVLCLRYEPDSRSVRWCRAGHLPALVRRADGRVDVLDGDGSPPIGVFEGSAFRESEAELGPDDVVVLYTDGLVEKPGEDIDVSIAALADRLSELEVGPSFLDCVVAPLADTDRRDDVAVLVLST
jgi:serine phosphatase RsbU (regulator of sigma subunit)